MVVESIDVMQTEQIETLQVDIQELETKLNLAVGDVNQLTVKLNAVIVDLRNLYEALMGSDSTDEYSPSGGTSTDGLLTRLDELYTVFWDHIHMPPFSSTLQTYRSSHPPYVLCRVVTVGGLWSSGRAHGGGTGGDAERVGAAAWRLGARLRLSRECGGRHRPDVARPLPARRAGAHPTSLRAIVDSELCGTGPATRSGAQ